MSKKRVFVLFVLNMLLLVTCMVAMIRIFFDGDGHLIEGAVSQLQIAEILCPLLLMVITFIYLLALVHAFHYKGRTPKFIDAIRLMIVVAEVLIALIEFALMIPYRGRFDLTGIEFYLFIAIPVLSFISFIPTRKKYSLWGLLYSLLPLAAYVTTIITLAAFNYISLPYKFLDILNQQAYKSAINFAILVAGNTMIASLLILITAPSKLENC